MGGRPTGHKERRPINEVVQPRPSLDLRLVRAEGTRTIASHERATMHDESAPRCHDPLCRTRPCLPEDRAI